ncbi:MAG: leucine-rich repeat domain-containing protein, partial [Tidjanibacter sp.]|nr:leucine-rich repeat domain-containing protein [Tidjanibacter sp.]
IINSKIVETDYIYETYPSQYGWLRGAKFSKLTIGNGVTSIGDHTFEGCSSLTSITIPDSVTEIGEWAFSGCKSLTSITIPDSVTSIGYQAFYKCTSLTSITIPESVTSIGELAFAYCYSLTSVYCKPTTPPTGGSYMFDYNASGRKIYVPTQSVKAYKSASYWSDYASYIVGYDF